MMHKGDYTNMKTIKKYLSIKPNTIRFDLSQIKHWEFAIGKKVYKLNVKELIRLLKETKT